MKENLTVGSGQHQHFIEPPAFPFLQKITIPAARLRLCLHTPGVGGLTTSRGSPSHPKTLLTFGTRLLMFGYM